MSIALHIFATGIQAQKDNVAILANDIANMETIGYKSNRPVFHDLAYENRNVGTPLSTEGNIHPTGIQMGRGVYMTGTARNMAAGSIELTDDDLDLAIQDKNSFFQIESSTGETHYTRAGKLMKGPDGTLENMEGNKLLPNITIPENATHIAINPNGQVYVRLSGEVAHQELGTIETAKFINPAGLEALGGTMFKETAASGGPQVGTPGSEGFGTLKQGALEKSNVQSWKALFNLMEAQSASGQVVQGAKIANQIDNEASKVAS